MKHKKIKSIIIILMIILFIILIKLKNIINEKGGIKNILSSNNTYTEENWDEEEPGIDEEVEDSDYEDETDISDIRDEVGLRDSLYMDKPIEVTSSIYFATVKNIIETFLKDIGEMNTKQYINKTYEYALSNSDLRKKTYDRLTRTYLNKNEIEIDNISQKLRMPYRYFSLNIKKVFQYAIKNNQVLRFAVCIEIKDEDVDIDEEEDKNKDYKENVKTNNFIVYLDYENQSYAIEPVGSKNIEDVKLDAEITEIEKNINNSYTYLNGE